MADIHLNISLTNSEKTALDKVLTSKINLEGTLRDNSNVINPSIEIQGNVTSIAGRNYFEIPEFGRSYFITDVVSTGYGTCIIQGHVDVLATYKTAIRANIAVIGRSETRYNLFIDDGLFKTDSKTIIQTKKFTGGGHFTTTPGIALVVVG